MNLNYDGAIGSSSNLYREAINAISSSYTGAYACDSCDSATTYTVHVSSLENIKKEEPKSEALTKEEKPKTSINEQLEASFGFKLGELDIKRVIFSDPCTIILWKDGTKTIVRVHEDEKFNPYYGFCAAIVKKMFGSNSKLNKFVDQWIAKNETNKKNP